jgi:hypothetical protein
MPRKKKQKAKNLNRQLSTPELKLEKAGKKKKLPSVDSAGDIYKYDYDADYESPKKSNSRPTSPIPFFMPILEYGFSWPRRKSPFRSTSSEKNVVSPLSSPDSGFPGSPCQVVPTNEIIDHLSSSNGILSSDTGDSDKDKESDKENLEVDYVIASLDDIIENEESDPEIYMREISSEKAEDESVNIDDTIESETFSVRRFQVKELILDYENKKNEKADQTIFPINGLQKEYLDSHSEGVDRYCILSKSDGCLNENQNNSELKDSTTSLNCMNGILNPIIKEGKVSSSGKKVRFNIDPHLIRKSVSCNVFPTPIVEEVCEWEVTVKEIEIPESVNTDDDIRQCIVTNSFQIMVRI